MLFRHTSYQRIIRKVIGLRRIDKIRCAAHTVCLQLLSDLHDVVALRDGNLNGAGFCLPLRCCLIVLLCCFARSAAGFPLRNRHVWQRTRRIIAASAHRLCDGFRIRRQNGIHGCGITSKSAVSLSRCGLAERRGAFLPCIVFPAGGHSNTKNHGHKNCRYTQKPAFHINIPLLTKRFLLYDNEIQNATDGTVLLPMDQTQKNRRRSTGDFSENEGERKEKK